MISETFYLTYLMNVEYCYIQASGKRTKVENEVSIFMAIPMGFSEILIMLCIKTLGLFNLKFSQTAN